MADGRRSRGYRQPRPLAGAVARVRGGLAPPTLLGRVQTCWSAAVGGAIAEQASPVRERGGVVSVACRSATWAAELTMLSRELLERLNEELGGAAEVRELRFSSRPF